LQMGARRDCCGALAESELSIVRGQDTSQPRAATELGRASGPPCCAPGARPSLVDDWMATPVPDTASSRELALGVEADSFLLREAPVQRQPGRGPQGEWRPAPLMPSVRNAMAERARFVPEGTWESSRAKKETRR